MRKIINISLPEKLEADVNREVKKGNYASKSEFFRALLREWQAGKLLVEINESRAEIKAGKGKVLDSLEGLR
jgi:Arc/MetJ-type ribon-helix-helix transcriptional regulator